MFENALFSIGRRPWAQSFRDIMHHGSTCHTTPLCFAFQGPPTPVFVTLVIALFENSVNKCGVIWKALNHQRQKRKEQTKKRKLKTKGMKRKPETGLFFLKGKWGSHGCDMIVTLMQCSVKHVLKQSLSTQLLV